MITRQTLRSQARDIILKQIVQGELKPGEMINLSELSASLGISRTPLREALLSLTGQGLIAAEGSNQGFYVWPLTLKEAGNLVELARVLESLAVRTTRRVSQERIEEMRITNNQLAEVQGNPEAMIELDDRVHELLIAGTDNEELLKIVRQIRKRFSRYRWYGYDYVMLHGSGEKIPSVSQHAEIIDRMEQGNMEAAARLVDLHWGRALELLELWLPKAGGQKRSEHG